MTAPSDTPHGTVDPDEVARFEALAAEWWDPNGKLRPLHRFNPARLRVIRDRAARHFGRAPETDRPLEGLRLLDIGCGGGLVAEPMARLGAEVTGIDPSEANVAVARRHADGMGLSVAYRAAAAEDLAAEGARFDVVLALEVIEHVADPPAFLDAVARLTRPGGLTALATLDRTARSYALAIVGAEYVLGWLPRGTHDWNRFIRPPELAGMLAARGFGAIEATGLSYNPLAGRWRESADTGVNYMTFAVREE